MKKVLLLICFILICFMFVVCVQKGKLNNINVNLGESKQFTENEIDEAINCVKDKFKDFEGCELTSIWYDEEKSNTAIEGYMSNGNGSNNGVSEENVIILLSNFDTDSFAGAEGLNPNSSYSDWMWILIRDSKASKWKVDDWGY